MLDAAMLGTLLRSAKRDLFRMEARDSYDVPTDGGDFGRYIHGEPGPDMARKAAWHARLAADRSRGLRRWRVHAFTEPLSPYLRFEFEWGHALNAALEEIRVLPLRPDHGLPSLALTDFWLVDDREAVSMHYDQAGRFLGATVEPPAALAGYRQARDAAWSAAAPFTKWWRTHPQYHRREAA